MSPLSLADLRPYKQRAVATSFLKGLQLMTLLARNPQGLTVSSLRQRLKFPRTTTLRLLSTLELFGLAAQQGVHWRATPRFYDWRERDTHAEIRQRFAKTLGKLAGLLDELVMLGAAEGDGIRFIDYVQSNQRVIVAPPKNSLYPLQKSACGKLVLSQRPDLCAAIRDSRLRDEVALAGRTGLAWNHSETDANIDAVATWAGQPSSLTPLIAVIWPSHRFSEAKALKAVAVIRRHLPR